MYAIERRIQVRPNLELKTRPRVRPVSISCFSAKKFNVILLCLLCFVFNICLSYIFVSSFISPPPTHTHKKKIEKIKKTK